jgi:transposase-like protein
MNSHKNASLTPKGREAMVRSVTEGGLNRAAAARQFNMTAKTVAKWVERFRAEGPRDRSSRPLSLPSQTAPATCAAVEALRGNATPVNNRGGSRRFSGYRQSHPAAVGIKPDTRSGAGRACAPL